MTENNIHIEICPSILPADFSRLGLELEALEEAGADRGEAAHAHLREREVQGLVSRLLQWS